MSSSEQQSELSATVTGARSEDEVQTEPTRDTTEPNESGPGRRFIFGLSVSIAACILLLLFANQYWFFLHAIIDTLGNFRWQWLVLLSLLTLYQLARKRFFWALALVALMAWPTYQVAQLYIPVESRPDGPAKISMLTINVLSMNTRYEDVLDLIKNRDPDVLNLVEYDEFWFKRLDDQLQKYPYRIGPYHQNAMYSKFPIKEIEESKRRMPNKTYGCGGIGWAGDQQVLFWAIHTTSPTSLQRLKQRDVQIDNLTAPFEFHRRYRHVVVAGDFNATTYCPSIDRFLVESHLRDSRPGFGMQNSWPVWCPPLAICIDHVFVSQHVRVHSRLVDQAIGSDHHPVYCELSFGKHKRGAPLSQKEALIKLVPNRFQTKHPEQKLKQPN